MALVCLCFNSHESAIPVAGGLVGRDDDRSFCLNSDVQQVIKLFSTLFDKQECLQQGTEATGSGNKTQIAFTRIGMPREQLTARASSPIPGP